MKPRIFLTLATLLLLVPLAGLHAADVPNEVFEAGPNLTLFSPLDYQVIQRTSKNTGTMVIRGELGRR